MKQESYDIFLTVIKNRILDQYYQNWYRQYINNSQRLTSYCRFKHEFTLEPYHYRIHEKHFKIALSRFRLSSHDLEIERGRYSNIPREDRICKLCSLNVVESAYNFLLVCPLYIDLRRKYIKPYYCTWPTLNKLIKYCHQKIKM